MISGYWSLDGTIEYILYAMTITKQRSLDLSRKKWSRFGLANLTTIGSQYLQVNWVFLDKSTRNLLAIIIVPDNILLFELIGEGNR